MREIFKSIWHDIINPSHRSETPYVFALIAIGHIMLGAMLAFLANTAWVGLLIVLVYWLLKEMGDLRRGGSVWDGLIDTAFFAVGVMSYDGGELWPAFCFALVGIVTFGVYWVKSRFFTSSSDFPET